jgi:hypothetical protein
LLSKIYLLELSTHEHTARNDWHSCPCPARKSREEKERENGGPIGFPKVDINEGELDVCEGKG